MPILELGMTYPKISKRVSNFWELKEEEGLELEEEEMGRA